MSVKVEFLNKEAGGIRISVGMGEPSYFNSCYDIDIDEDYDIKSGYRGIKIENKLGVWDFLTKQGMRDFSEENRSNLVLRRDFHKDVMTELLNYLLL